MLGPNMRSFGVRPSGVYGCLMQRELGASRRSRGPPCSWLSCLSSKTLCGCTPPSLSLDTHADGFATWLRKHTGIENGNPLDGMKFTSRCEAEWRLDSVGELETAGLPVAVKYQVGGWRTHSGDQGHAIAPRP